MSEQLMILVAGPYRSGTSDDPALVQRNVDAMEDMALAVVATGERLKKRIFRDLAEVPERRR